MKLERRYGRANERYRTKIPVKKRKSPSVISIKGQTVLCSILLVAGIITFYADADNVISDKISYSLYHTNTFGEWKETFLPAAYAVKDGTVKAVVMWTDTIYSWEERLGIIGSKKSSAVNAKAQKQSDENKTKTKKKEAALESDEKNQIKKNTENIDEGESREESTPQFKPPINGEITSSFGERVHPLEGNTSLHTGIDIAAETGDTVISAAPGMVSAVGYDDANGHYVVIKHNDTLTTVYAHLSKKSVTEGERVDSNTKIGEVGSTGISTGPHLHFEIKENSQSVNPENYITLKHRKGV